MTVAISGQERVGLRLDGTTVLAFTTDGYEGECMVGRKVSARLVKFRYHRAGTGKLIQTRTAMFYKNGRWVPRRSVAGDPMTPTRVRRSDLRQLDRCLHWMREANPQVHGMKPLLKD